MIKISYLFINAMKNTFITKTEETRYRLYTEKRFTTINGNKIKRNNIKFEPYFDVIKMT